jgi:AcrR family transcriptional regulator
MTKTSLAKGGRPDKHAAALLGQHIVDVADSLFVAKGYAVTSMATIALHARIGKQTPYHRYPDKAALFHEVVSRRINRMLLLVDDVRAGDPLAEVKMLGRAALANVVDPEFVTLNRIVIAESNHFPELGSFAVDCWGCVFVGRCAELIRNAQCAGVCKTGDPTAIARIFLWSLVGAPFYSALIGGDAVLAREDDLNDYFEMAWQLFLHGVVSWKNPGSLQDKSLA